jgi:hypothetical protein
MPNLKTNYNWGTSDNDSEAELYRKLTDSYNQIALIVNNKVTVYVTTSDPPSSDPINQNFNVGDEWVNSSSDSAWKMTSRTSNIAATWTLIT